MTHVERLRRVIARQPVDRIPLRFWASPEMTAQLETYLGCSESAICRDVFDIDLGRLNPEYIGPPETRHADGTFTDLFGVTYKQQHYAGGTYIEEVGFPLAHMTSVREVERHCWPVPDWYDYAGASAALAQSPDKAFVVGYLALGWTCWKLRGFSQFLQDLLVEPLLAEAIIQRVSDFGYAYFERLLDACQDQIRENFVAIHLADDWATQEGLLISPQLYRDFFKEHYRRIIDLAHRYDCLVEFHCCGSVLDLIPELIDTGIDILNPIQTSARGMAPKTLNECFGSQLCFHGGVDVQTVLPNGTVSQVEQAVFGLLDTLGVGGGYILGPSHAVQVGTPPENVVAMYRAAYDYYGTPYPPALRQWLA